MCKRTRQDEGYQPGQRGYQPQEPTGQPDTEGPGAGYQPEIGQGDSDNAPPEDL